MSITILWMGIPLNRMRQGLMKCSCSIPRDIRKVRSLFSCKTKGRSSQVNAIPVAGDLPVDDDAALSVKSVKRLREIAGIRVLLSSWDKNRKGVEAYQRMDEALEYLRVIHEAVLTVYNERVTDPWNLQKNRCSTRAPTSGSHSYAGKNLCSKSQDKRPGETAGGLLKIRQKIFRSRLVFIFPHLNQPLIKFLIKAGYPHHFIRCTRINLFSIIACPVPSPASDLSHRSCRWFHPRPVHCGAHQQDDDKTLSVPESPAVSQRISFQNIHPSDHLPGIRSLPGDDPTSHLLISIGTRPAHGRRGGTLPEVV